MNKKETLEAILLYMSMNMDFCYNEEDGKRKDVLSTLRHNEIGYGYVIGFIDGLIKGIDKEQEPN